MKLEKCFWKRFFIVVNINFCYFASILSLDLNKLKYSLLMDALRQIPFYKDDL